jgi:putative ABC transport system substrate-binding protein
MNNIFSIRTLRIISDNLKSKRRPADENPKWVGLFAIAVALTVCGGWAEAQQPKKVPRIGYLGNTASTSTIDMKPFRERLRDLGYIEGQNVASEYRYFDGKVERLPDLVAELVRLNCDVIVAIGNEAAGAAKNATKVIPIVMASTNDAVKSGLVASLARPGGNVTGLTGFGGEIIGKRLELFKEIIPKLSRVGFLWSPTSPVAADNLKETETVARSLRIGLQSLEVKGPDDIDGAFRAATNKRAGALLVDGGGLFTAQQKRIIELAAKSRLPTMYGNSRYVEAGGLMSYAGDRIEQYRRAAEIVDKILKGTKPADISVERPKKFELVINLKAAKQIGLTIPPNVLVRAQKVIR